MATGLYSTEQVNLFNLFNLHKAAESKTMKGEVSHQCDQIKMPNFYKSCPKMISLEKGSILTPLQKLPKNVQDLGKVIVAKGFKKLPKVQ